MRCNSRAIERAQPRAQARVQPRAQARSFSRCDARSWPLGARRNAVAYLGGTAGRGGERAFGAVALAFRAEKAAGMRRTAGDALSDLGDARAVPHAIAALEDGASLVRWRAACILGELGETAAVASALIQAALAEKAFEVHPRTLTLSAQPGGTPARSLV